ncbi:UNVERIFIED_CONTAM: hypothetical protein Slati_3593600 [Sesamum latifolium]|uniref:Mitochondrial import inner membrane translocase subunit TIM50 n=1 Tax=Sesamum latifolium TaxID=2727402 RepID=A0AAW2TZM5_9LAMI
MAEKSKLKNVISDESSDEERQPATDLDLPFDKLNLGPQKKLLVLCLGGLLVHRLHVRGKASIRGLRPDIFHGSFLVFKRPFCTEFLKFCFERFEVGLWSSAVNHNVGAVLSEITGGTGSNFLFVWGQEECTDSGFGCLHKKHKPCSERTEIPVGKKKYYKEKYSASNTLLIDDEPHKCLINPPNTAIFPHPYRKHDTNDSFLGPNGELCKFLDGLSDAKDVPSYVKDHRIGQPAITPSHPDWSYYAKIVGHFDRRGD